MNPFEFEFMQRALLACVLVGAAAPSVGVFLVQRRLSLMGDGIGHVAFTGVAAGLFAGVSPVVTALIAAALGAAAIEVLRGRGRSAGDLALALIFYGGIAGGALLAYKAGAATDALGYLFGSVLTVDRDELVLLGLVALTVVVLANRLRAELFAVCYDEEVAGAAGLPVGLLNHVIAFSAALTIGVTMRVVGLLLVSAMLVLPVAAAQQLTKTFRGTVSVSMLLGASLAALGLLLSFYGDLAPGATIVVVAIAAFVATGAASLALTRWGTRTR